MISPALQGRSHRAPRGMTASTLTRERIPSWVALLGFVAAVVVVAVVGGLAASGSTETYRGL